MPAYYNEFDPNAAAWLRELIARGLIAPGEVDERSISDVQPDDLKGFVQCHFFAGIGGWSYALRLALWPDDRPVWTGSCPCQPFSAAGKRKGFDDERHLWPVFRGLIRECAPSVVFGEQVAAASDWLRLVRGDLEALGYAVGAMPVEAASAGADHLRDRYWFVAHADNARSQGRPAERERAGQRPAGQDGLAHAHVTGEGEGREQRSGQLSGAGGDPKARDGDMADAHGNGAGNAARSGDCAQGSSVGFDWRLSRAGAAAGFDGAKCPVSNRKCGPGDGRPDIEKRASEVRTSFDRDSREHDWVIGADGKARRVKPGVRLLAHGFPHRVGLLRGFGNAIDPRPAAAFIKAADEAMSAHTRPEAA